MKHGRRAWPTYLEERWNLHANAKNLTGQIAGRLTALYPLPERDKKTKEIIWVCKCSCGLTKNVKVTHFGKGTNSCGCYRREIALAKIRHTHTGRTADIQKWELLGSARWKSKKHGIPFNLDLEDIVIPEFCPLLEIRLVRGSGKVHNQSPSLDRIDPNGGYVKGNVQVISWRANTLKRDASLEEMKLLVKNWEAMEGK